MFQTLLFLLTFALLASPAYFRFLRSVVGGWAASPAGLAKPAGLLLAGLALMFIIPFERRLSGFSKLKDPCTGAANLQAKIDKCQADADPDPAAVDTASVGTSEFGLFGMAGGGGGLGLGGSAGIRSSSAINICDNLDKYKAIQATFQARCDNAKNS